MDRNFRGIVVDRKCSRIGGIEGNVIGIALTSRKEVAIVISSTCTSIVAVDARPIAPLIETKMPKIVPHCKFSNYDTTVDVTIVCSFDDDTVIYQTLADIVFDLPAPHVFWRVSHGIKRRLHSIIKCRVVQASRPSWAVDPGWFTTAGIFNDNTFVFSNRNRLSWSGGRA